MLKSLIDKIHNCYTVEKNAIRTYRETLDRYDTIWKASCNDIGILYDKVKRKYILEIESNYCFQDDEAGNTYLRDLLSELSNWMEFNGYSKNGQIGLLAAFNMKEKEFDTIEQLYAYFKMLVEGKV